MKLKSIGFIGCGRITRIILSAWNNKGIELSSVIVCDPDKALLMQLKRQFPKINITDSQLLSAGQEFVFLALHPPAIPDVLENLKMNVSAKTTIISLAPKITIENIASVLSQVKSIVRLIPNATSIINQGYNPISFAKDESEKTKKEILRIFHPLGHIFEVEQSDLERYAVLSAMLPTYFWFQIKELVNIGCQIGLANDESRKTVKESLLSAINTYFDSGLSPDEVIDLIPVKPLGEFEPEITKAYYEKLIALYEKIKSIK
ncbi:MAG: NAD(P)-binding domain-containing protein [Bacteroidales bacterium]|nr:NAD(P)-binding domain-containing protein [Bacteroidales bacterium]